MPLTSGTLLARRTVFACATNAGSGRGMGMTPTALAIIRISGPQAHDALHRLTPSGGNGGSSRKAPASSVASSSSSSSTTTPSVYPYQARKMVRRQLIDPRNGDMLDDAMVVTFDGPHSATGEDIAELHLHGSPAVVKDVLAALSSLHHEVGTPQWSSSSCPQYREMDIGLAPPGEFTRRAFANGKLDLTQVEGIRDLLHAKTSAQRKVALSHVSGELSMKCAKWRDALVRALAFLEAAIDFGEDEEVPDEETLQPALAVVKSMRETLRMELQRSERVATQIHDGFKVVFCGAPNAGKSSLLNLVTRTDAAIVSAIPGTTRDVIDVMLDVGGFPVLLHDTAGVHSDSETAQARIDVVEQIGVAKALKLVKTADIPVATIDAVSLVREGTASVPDVVWEIIRTVDQLVIVFNKVDELPKGISPQDVLLLVPQNLRSRVAHFHSSGRVAFTSCTQEQGLDDVLSSMLVNIKSLVASDDPRQFGEEDSVLVAGERQRTLLAEAVASLDTALAVPSDVILVAEGVRRAIRAVGGISGDTDVERMLDVVFAEFCIGK